MVYSDGYFPDGSASRDPLASDSSASEVLVAIETQPIPQLSVHSQPGIKVIVSGAIDVRFGVLMLHPGNTTVVGGFVPSLIPVQKQAIDMAARLAGVGIGMNVAFAYYIVQLYPLPNYFYIFTPFFVLLRSNI